MVSGVCILVQITMGSFKRYPIRFVQNLPKQCAKSRAAPWRTNCAIIWLSSRYRMGMYLPCSILGQLVVVWAARNKGRVVVVKNKWTWIERNNIRLKFEWINVLGVIIYGVRREVRKWEKNVQRNHNLFPTFTCYSSLYLFCTNAKHIPYVLCEPFKKAIWYMGCNNLHSNDIEPSSA